MKITIFSEELRECLNAAGLSDCGENDTWNYWYQRLMNAYNESVERQIMTEQAENAKLREQMERLVTLLRVDCDIDASWDGLRSEPTRNVVEPTTLLPCPFCGGAPRIQHLFTADEPTHSRVICTNCHAKTDYYVYEFGERNIIKVWNRRADHD